MNYSAFSAYYELHSDLRGFVVTCTALGTVSQSCPEPSHGATRQGVCQCDDRYNGGSKERFCGGGRLVLTSVVLCFC